MPTPSATSSRDELHGGSSSRGTSRCRVAWRGAWRIVPCRDCATTMARVTPPRVTPSTVWNHDGETDDGLAGSQLAAGRDVVARSRPTSRSTRPEARPRCGCACSTTTASRRAHRLTEHSLGDLARRAARRRPGHALRLPRRRRRGTPRRGLRFNPAKLLLDPYAPRGRPGDLVVDPAIFGYADGRPRRPRSDLDSAPYVPRSVVVHDDFDWGDDTPLRRRWRDTVIYELHVKGMTALHDRVPEELRGTYAGLAAPAVIDYLKRPRRDRGRAAARAPVLLRAGAGRARAWSTTGATTRSASSPRTTRYSSAGDRGQQVTEFKQMVKALPRRRARGDPRRRLQPHRRGRPARADAVASAASTTAASTSAWCRRRRSRAPSPSPTRYWDVTGCGNTVDATHTQSLRMILDSLRYWVTEMHVDGFRFDLMSRADPHRPRRRHGLRTCSPRSARTRCCGT